MSCFSYLLKRNVVNYIKSIKHKPSKAVPIVFYVVMLFFLVFATLSNYPRIIFLILLVHQL